MINVTQDFLTAIRAADRKLEIKVQIGTVELNDSQIIEYSIERNLGSGNAPTIGSIPSAKLELSILKSELPESILGQKIIPWVGLELPNSTIEWVKMGEFYVNPNEIEIEKMTVNMTAFDNMSSYNFDYDSQLTYPTTLTNVLTEISNQFDIDFASGWENITINTKLEGTVREVLGLIATLLTKNAIINRDGEVEFIFTNQTNFTLNENNYIDFKLTAMSNVRMSQMVVKVGEGEEEQEFVVGDSNGFAMFLENSAIQTESELQTIFDRHYPMYFFAYDLQLQGMPHIELGDIISLTDVEGVQRNIIILNHKLTFQGGLISEFSVDAPKSDILKVDNRGIGGTIGDSVRKVYDNIDSAIINATQLITGNEGGYIVTRMDSENKPYEMLIMDNENIDFATNVWRWNSSGLGHSSTGYAGTYGTAITADGQIVADFMTTGTLSAGVIGTGSITIGKIDSQVGKELDISDNNAITSLAGSIDSNYSLITQNASSISSLVSDVDSNYSLITQNASSISAKVGNDEVINKINLSSEGVKISKTKINATFGDVTQTVINGGLITTGALLTSPNGALSGVNAGIKADGNIRFWAGATKDNAQHGSFFVTQNGSLYSRSAYLDGASFGSFNYSSGNAGGKNKYSGAGKGVFEESLLVNSLVENIKGTFSELKGDSLDISKIKENGKQGITSNNLRIGSQEIDGILQPGEEKKVVLNSLSFTPIVKGKVVMEFKDSGINIINKTDESQEYHICTNFIEESVE